MEPSEQGRYIARQIKHALADVRFPVPKERLLDRLQGRTAELTPGGRAIRLDIALGDSTMETFRSPKDVARELVLLGAFRGAAEPGEPGVPEEPEASRGAAEGPTGEPMSEGEAGVAGDHVHRP